MAKVLLYNFSREDRRKKVKALLFRLAVPSREVRPEEQADPLGVLLELPGYEAGTERETGEAVPAGGGNGEHGEPEDRFTDEMIVMHGLNSRQFGVLLDGLRKSGVFVPMKAATTPYNVNWTSAELYRELNAEHAAVSGGGRPLHENPGTDGK